MNQTLTISPLVKKTIYRAFDALYDSTLEKGPACNDNNDENIVTIRVGNFLVKYDIYIPYHSEECEHENETSETDECGCNTTREYTAYLSYNLRESHGRVNLNEYEFTKDTDKSKLFEWIDTIPDTYQICNCGNELVKRDGWCTMCYIYRYERTEEEGGNCCVCLENEGRWIKLKCNHILHKSCFLNLTKLTCPLCREPQCGHGIVDDPYLI